ncbi:hypothetical protein [Dyadobacter crusticola]|uniref:hypothetical protein n=1 Tax=Dyadobacter crusticola TaxID=292407 RepID=UPI0004E18EF0|nr:hypothetical protein [Dyadobacter crusticola]
MTLIKLIFLFVLIMMMQYRGIIYRTGKKNTARDELRAIRESILPKSANMNGSWRMYGVNKTDPSVIIPGDKGVDNTPFSEKELFISFFPDGNFTQIRDNADYNVGKWSYDSSSQSVFLTSERMTQEVGVQFRMAEGGIRVMNFSFNPTEGMLLMEFAKPVVPFREDPFYPENNTWRIKPAKSENDAEIRARLRNYLLHNAYILKAAKSREQDNVSWEFSEGIIKIYNPGIGIVKVDKIPASWIDGFYSKDEALKAYRLFEQQLKFTRHKGGGKGNWVEQNYNILYDIYQGMGKSPK